MLRINNFLAWGKCPNHKNQSNWWFYWVSTFISWVSLGTGTLQCFGDNSTVMLLTCGSITWFVNSEKQWNARCPWWTRGLPLRQSKIIITEKWIPGILAGEIGPDRDWLLPTGEPTGEGDGPPGMLERCGDACGEKGDWAGLLWSPWLLVDPDALTAELRVASVPVGRSSMEPDRSWERKKETPYIYGVTYLDPYLTKKLFKTMPLSSEMAFLDNTQNSKRGHLLLEDFQEVSRELNPKMFWPQKLNKAIWQLSFKLPAPSPTHLFKESQKQHLSGDLPSEWNGGFNMKTTVLDPST